MKGRGTCSFEPLFREDSIQSRSHNHIMQPVIVTQLTIRKKQGSDLSNNKDFLGRGCALSCENSCAELRSAAFIDFKGH